MKARTAIGDDKLAAAVARLRGEAVQKEYDDEADGYEHGQAWALEQASPVQLIDMQTWSTTNWTWAEVQNVTVRGEFLEHLRLGSQDPWCQGFVAGAMDAWRQLSVLL